MGGIEKNIRRAIVRTDAKYHSTMFQVNRIRNDGATGRESQNQR